VKNWQTTGIEKKSEVISRIEKGERIFDISRNVTVAFNNVCTIPDNADRIKKVPDVEII